MLFLLTFFKDFLIQITIDRLHQICLLFQKNHIEQIELLKMSILYFLIKTFLPLYQSNKAIDQKEIYCYKSKISYLKDYLINKKG